MSDTQQTAATPEAPQQTDGIVSGPGNNGTANTAQLQGHAGTPASFLGIPRQMKFGQPGAMPQ